VEEVVEVVETVETGVEVLISVLTMDGEFVGVLFGSELTTF